MYGTQALQGEGGDGVSARAARRGTRSGVQGSPLCPKTVVFHCGTTGRWVYRGQLGVSTSASPPPPLALPVDGPFWLPLVEPVGLCN